MKYGGSNIGNASAKTPVVSVVCVTRNAANTLPFFLHSVNEKKTKEIELIIIDGSSTDDTLNLLQQFENVIDFWLSEPDAGIYDAMNKAVNYANGQWVIFIGADDILYEGFTDVVSFLKESATIYYGNVNYYGKLFTKVYDDYYLTKLNICHQSIFYPKAVFAKYKFDTRYNVYADYDLNLKCWKDDDFKFEHIDCLVASFADGGYSSYTKDPSFETDKEMLFKKYLKRASYWRYLNRTYGFWKMLRQIMFEGLLTPNSHQ